MTKTVQGARDTSVRQDVFVENKKSGCEGLINEFGG